MANIIDKVFDASMGILKATFLGNPNLFSTADLNRQIDMAKYQMDSTERRIGYESDLNIIAKRNSDNGKIDCTFSGSYIIFSGCKLQITSGSVSVNVADTLYVIGTYSKQLITYTNDTAEHKISGASFADGTSMAAANHVVAKSLTISVETTTNLLNVETDSVGHLLIGKIKVTSTGVFVYKNYLSKNDSMAFREPSIGSLPGTNSLGIGSTYDEAFAYTKDRLDWINYIRKFDTDWTGNDNLKWKLLNGNLYLKVSGLVQAIQNRKAPAAFINLTEFTLQGFPEELRDTIATIVGDTFVNVKNETLFYPDPTAIINWDIKLTFPQLQLRAYMLWRFSVSGSSYSTSTPVQDIVCIPLI